MIISNGRIVPGRAIYPFVLGMQYEEVIEYLNGEYIRNNRESGSYVLVVENAHFFFNKQNRLYQIGVTKGFDSKLDNSIGIGSTMSDAKKIYGAYFDEFGQYVIKGVEGIYFSLEDDEGEWDPLEEDEEEWDELTAPIEWIFVYDVNLR